MTNKEIEKEIEWMQKLDEENICCDGEYIISLKTAELRRLVYLTKTLATEWHKNREG